VRWSAVRNDHFEARIGRDKGGLMSVRGKVKDNEVGKKSVLDLNSDFHK
jgi:hypothetical protein